MDKVGQEETIIEQKRKSNLGTQDMYRILCIVMRRISPKRPIDPTIK